MTLRGLKSHVARLNKLPAAAEKAVTAALFAAAERIAVEAQLSITRGAIQGKGHVRSLPGQAPNQEFGTLDGSIEATRNGKLKAKVSANAGHAVPLEFGTSKMAARPFMRPARDKKKDEARDLVAKGLNAALKAARTNAG